jgi:hypothetical protein
MANTASSARAEVTLRSKTMVLDFEGGCGVERTSDSVRLTGLRLVANLPNRDFAAFVPSPRANDFS